MKIFFRMFMLVTITLLIYSCSSSSEDDIIDPGNKKVTYNGNVKSIMTDNCTSCHGSPTSNGAPFSLTNYNEVKSRASSILAATSSGSMPKGKSKLPQSTINVIDKWIKDGLLEK